MKNLVIFLIIIVILFEFFYANPFGISIGYRLSGGEMQSTIERKNPDALLRNYNDYVRTYELYKNSENATAQKWAMDAKEKANNVAHEYNILIGEYKLDYIGE